MIISCFLTFYHNYTFLLNFSLFLSKIPFIQCMKYFKMWRNTFFSNDYIVKSLYKLIMWILSKLLIEIIVVNTLRFSWEFKEDYFVGDENFWIK